MILALAAAVLGTVVAVHDGDTLRVRTREGAQVTLRLAMIDAPEVASRGARCIPAQPYSCEARAALIAACLGQRAVTVGATRRDRYGRTLARVRCGRRMADLALLRAGLAWIYPSARPKPTPSLLAAEARARRARVGLWADPAPVAPWDWRRSRR